MYTMSEETLQEAALQLLASSTSKRYLREATRITRDSGLMSAARDDLQVAHQLTDRLKQLLQTISKDQRPPEEFEAALILCTLARCGFEDISVQLRMLAAPDQLHSPWLRCFVTGE